MSVPVSDEVAGALGQFFHMGSGPSHGALSRVFLRAGYGDAAPYDTVTKTPNKELRVQAAVRAAVRRPDRARELVQGLLTELRLTGAFADGDQERQAVRTAQAAFRRTGWSLSDDGVLGMIGQIDLATGGREALDEQLDRLRRATDDPALLLGSAKDLLEAVAKFVLEELGSPQDGDFGKLMYLAQDRLGTHPSQVVPDGPAAEQVRKVLGSARNIADQVNEIRNVQGTGHGRTLSTGVTPELALLVVREACSVAQFMLATLDRALGRSG